MSNRNPWNVLGVVEGEKPRSKQTTAIMSVPGGTIVKSTMILGGTASEAMVFVPEVPVAIAYKDAEIPATAPTPDPPKEPKKVTPKKKTAPKKK